MAKNLLIVESPAKAKTIEGFLGADFMVKSSYGHIRDLAKGDKAIDIANGFKQLYAWLVDRDILIVRADRSEPLVVLPLKLAPATARP